jgi:hypothetical protein
MDDENLLVMCLSGIAAVTRSCGAIVCSSSSWVLGLFSRAELYTGAIRALWRELGEPAPSPPVSRTAASPASARSRFPIQVYDGDVCVGRVVVDGGRFRAETHYGTRLEDSAENAVRAVQ